LIQLDDRVFLYLRKLGYSEQRVAGMNMNTRLFRDLGEYGDSAIEECNSSQRSLALIYPILNFPNTSRQSSKAGTSLRLSSFPAFRLRIA
jgi:hypothetical protein